MQLCLTKLSLCFSEQKQKWPKGGEEAKKGKPKKEKHYAIQFSQAGLHIQTHQAPLNRKRGCKFCVSRKHE